MGWKGGAVPTSEIPSNSESVIYIHSGLLLNIRKAGMNCTLSFQLTAENTKSWNESHSFIPAYCWKYEKLEWITLFYSRLPLKIWKAGMNNTLSFRLATEYTKSGNELHSFIPACCWIYEKREWITPFHSSLLLNIREAGMNNTLSFQLAAENTKSGNESHSFIPAYCWIYEKLEWITLFHSSLLLKIRKAGMNHTLSFQLTAEYTKSWNE